MKRTGAKKGKKGNQLKESNGKERKKERRRHGCTCMRRLVLTDGEEVR